MASPQGRTVQRDVGRFNRRKGHEDEEHLVHIDEVSKKEQDLQYDYFHLFDDDHLVICRCCGEKGHVYDDCPERKCKHCEAFEKHASTACPTWRKCGRCRQCGHDSKDCKNTSQLPVGTIDTCDICGATGHVEEECVKLWWTAKEPVEMMPVRRLVKDCYNCGAHDDHWGDDCSYHSQHRDADPVSDQIKTWSAEHADKFEDPEVQDSDDEYSDHDDYSDNSDYSRNDRKNNKRDYDNRDYDNRDDSDDNRDARKKSKRDDRENHKREDGKTYKRDHDRPGDMEMESEEEGEVKESPLPARNWFVSLDESTLQS